MKHFLKSRPVQYLIIDIAVFMALPLFWISISLIYTAKLEFQVTSEGLKLWAVLTAMFLLISVGMLVRIIQSLSGMDAWCKHVIPHYTKKELNDIAINKT